MRNHLISLDAENERNLLEIQKSISILVLDDRSPVTMSEVLQINCLSSVPYTIFMFKKTDKT